MNIIKPKKLKKGNTIAFLGVSGKIKEYEKLLSAKEFFEKEGFNVIISNTCKNSHRYMTGTCDYDCVEELHSFFLNDEIDAILCARGGYGTLRLLEYIDWSIIKKHPKIFAGYSDITILLNMIFKKTGLITFHSAMPNGDFSQNIEDFTKNSFFSTLNGTKKEYKASNFVCYKEGNAQGLLFGGNLASLTSLSGLNFFPDENLILFLEDLNEPVYKIDRMLTQLFNIKKFRSRVKGIAFGEFKDIDNEEYFDELINELTEKLNIPVCRGFHITHNKIKDTLPVGIKCEFNSKSALIKIKDSYLL